MTLNNHPKRTNTTTALNCKRCRFYHGANNVVCGLHPYGPDSKICSDYASKFKDVDQGRTSKDNWSIRPFHNWKRSRKILILVLLMGTFGYGCLLKWLAINPTQPTTETFPKSGYLR